MRNLDNITINKHSSIRIEGAQTVYFDPFEIEKDANDADIILVTHEHFDHFDVKSIAKIAKADTVLVTPASMKEKTLAESGIKAEKCVFLAPDEEVEINGIAVKAVPAYNIGKPFHPKENQWIGYLVDMDETKYYVVGDSDLNDDIVKVKCDVALVPVGSKFTMDYEQGAALVNAIKPAAAIPTHYGSVTGTPKDGDKFIKLVKKQNPGVQTQIKIKF